MTLAPALLVVVLGQASAAPGPLGAWKLSGRFVEEQAVEDARCAATLDDLCRALGVEQEGFLEFRDGEVRYRGDGECWNVPFRAEHVEAGMAAGAFERPEPDGSAPPSPCAGESCTGRRVQLWRDGERVRVLGAMERLGACNAPAGTEEPETTVRFVPEQWLKSAATERAARLGVDLRRCRYKTEGGAGPPRPCSLTGEEMPLKVTRLLPGYCPDEAVIRMRVENVSGTPLLASVMVQRLDDSGRWREYSADVFGTEPFPKKVIAARIAKAGALEVRWRPRVASNARALHEGTYRIVATALIEGRPPARSNLGGFLVEGGVGCKKP